MGHYDECRDGYCPSCGAAPGNMWRGYCEFCDRKKILELKHENKAKKNSLSNKERKKK